jgi:hypothetical protein
VNNHQLYIRQFLSPPFGGLFYFVLEEAEKNPFVRLFLTHTFAPQTLQTKKPFISASRMKWLFIFV